MPRTRRQRVMEAAVTAVLPGPCWEVVLAHMSARAIMCLRAASRGGAEVTAGLLEEQVATICMIGVRIWNAATGETEVVFDHFLDEMCGASISADGRRVVVVHEASDVEVYDPRTWQRVSSTADVDSYVLSCALSDDGRRVVTGWGDAMARVHDAETGELSLELRGHAAAVSFCSFSPDHRRVLTVGDDRRAILFDATTGDRLRTFANDDWFDSCGFSRSGELVATAGDVSLCLWETATGRLALRLEHDEETLRSFALSPDASRLGTTGSWLGEDIKIQDAATGRVVLAIGGGHYGLVDDCAFSPDARRFVTAGQDGVLRFWDASDGSSLGAVLHAAPIRICDFLLPQPRPSNSRRPGPPNLAKRRSRHGKRRNLPAHPAYPL